MEGQSGLSELSVISWVSAVEGCPLSGVPLYFSFWEDVFMMSLPFEKIRLLMNVDSFNLKRCTRQIQVRMEY